MLTEATTDRITYAASVGAISSVAWLDWLRGVSDLAALLLPIAGFIWITLQIVNRIQDRKDDRNTPNDG